MDVLEFHPLANGYPLLKGLEYEEFKAGIQKAGKIREKVVLYEGKILDGRNRYRVGVELGLKIPTRKFDPETEGDPALFVENANDDRRHEAQEIIRRRRLARIERVAEARRSGESLRTIAENEGVSESTIRSDLEAASTAQGGCAVEKSTEEVANSVEPEGGKVRGRDNRTYTARPKRKPKPKAEPKQEEEKEPEVIPPTPTDAIGLPIPEKLRDVFAARSLFTEARKLQKGLAAKINEIALREDVSAGHLRKQLSRRERDGKPYFRSTELETVKLLIEDWTPHVACCPWCLREHDGKPQRSCKACHGENWIPHRLWKQCPAEDRQRVERLVEQ